MEEKLINKVTERFQFKMTTAIAGVCPDCRDIVTFSTFNKRFECINPECGFKATEEGERIGTKHVITHEDIEMDNRKYYGVDNIK